MKKLKMRAVTSGLAAMLMLVIALTCVWYRHGRPRALPAHSEQLARETADPVTEFRTGREQLRQRQRAELNDIIHSPDTDAETLAMAQRQLMALMETESMELQLEGILKSRGFEDVLVSAGNGAINVMVPSGALNRNNTAIIMELVLRQTGVTAGNVKIIPLN